MRPRPLLLAAALAVSGCTPRAPAAAAFCTARDSDAWVAGSIHLQRTYPRVLAVVASGEAPRAVRVRPLDLAAREPSGPEVELPVAAAYATLQAAANAARGGDLVAVMPGRYAGFVLDEKPDAGDGRYVHFKAMGAPGEVSVTSVTPVDGARWLILLRATHHVVIEGFELRGGPDPGEAPRKESWAGVMLDGDFGRTGKLTHHVVIARNYSHHHRMWGLHSTDSRTVLVQDNVFAASVREHSAYVSDGSDDYVIRRNVFFGSNAGGLQCNLDPEASLHELMKHPAFRGYPRAGDQAWARGVIARADKLFGANNYPDGRGVNFIIEDNVINENGRAGGGALNLAGLSDSLVQNNLLYDNLAHGIAQWDNNNPFDKELRDPGPRAPADVSGPASLPTFGCHGNVIRDNTVIMANKDRAALQAVHGSWGTSIQNNVLINDEPTSVEVSNSGIFKIAFGANVVNVVTFTRGAEALGPLAAALPDPARTVAGITRARFAAEVARYGQEPWIILDGHWWRLNPARPDFHPKKGSPLLAGKGDPRQQPARDLDGAPRAGADIGAFVAR